MAEIINGIRKGLFISGENDKSILNCRAHFLGADKPIDINYNTMVNILIEVGKAQMDRIIEGMKKDGEIPSIITKYVPERVEP